MPKSLLPELVRSAPLNFCCPSAFFAANKGVRSELLALRLGIAKRTVQEWRGKWKAGKLDCVQFKSCLMDSCPKYLKKKLQVRLKGR